MWPLDNTSDEASRKTFLVSASSTPAAGESGTTCSANKSEKEPSRASSSEIDESRASPESDCSPGGAESRMAVDETAPPHAVQIVTVDKNSARSIFTSDVRACVNDSC
jgi:hypothetical protein